MEWVHKTFGWMPKWKTEPKLAVVERIACKTLGLVEGDHCQASNFAQGGFNKLFRIDSSKGIYLFRAALPVYPSRKTRSEVATILWLRQNTTIPVPTIIGYDANSTNELGFEWVLMEMIPGQTLHRAWRTMSFEDKKGLVNTMASYQTELLQKTHFDRVGNIYIADHSHSDHVANPKQFQIGPMVSTTFFWADRFNLAQERGPFSDSRAWLSTRIQLLLQDLEEKLNAVGTVQDSDDEDDFDEAEEMLRVGQDLNKAFGELFRPCDPGLEVGVLWHNDLSDMNIIVNDSNQITGIVDWESNSVLPAWYSKQFPSFLQGSDRKTEPDRGSYAADEEEKDETAAPDSLDNQGTNSLYWEHLLEYEQTILRQTYVTEMERLNPGFTQDRQSAYLQLGFEYAITQCDNPFMIKRIRSWLSDARAGNVWNLTEPESTEV